MRPGHGNSHEYHTELRTLNVRCPTSEHTLIFLFFFIHPLAEGSLCESPEAH
jgi:hypothetical protein